jgi:DNA-binding MarR family transcriptional regulator
MMTPMSDPNTNTAVILSQLTLQLVGTCQRRQEMIAESAQLSLSEFRCLRAFGEASTLTVKEIAARMHLTSSRLTRIIDGLVKKKFVTRHMDETDRRIINVMLSEEGQQLALRVSDECVHVYERVLESIEPNLRVRIIDAVRVLDDKIRVQTDLDDTI